MKDQLLNRRDLTLGLAATALAAGTWPVAQAATPAARSTSAAAAAKIPPAAPVARIEPVREALWGETIVDPYRWMESADDRDWKPFMEGQAAHTRAVLDALPGREALAKRVAELSGDVAVATIAIEAGGRVFFEKRPRGADNFKLFVRQGVGGADKVLVDPTLLSQGGTHVSLDWWLPSPDGVYVVYGLSAAGSENSTAQVLEVATGTILPERIDRAQYANPSWLPDSSGFFFNRLAEGQSLTSTDYYRDSVCWLHRLRTDPKSDLKALARGQYPNVALEAEDFPTVIADPSSATVLAIVEGGVRPENPVYTAALADLLAGRPQWRQVCDVVDEVVGYALAGDALYLLTTRDAPNAKVVLTSAAAPDLAKARLVVPEGEAVVNGIAAARDGLYVRDMTGGYSSLRRRANDGTLATVPLPFEGAVAKLRTSTLIDGAWFSGTSWLQPNALFRCDPATARVTDSGISERPSVDLSGFEAIRTFATARDGTRVPMSIVAKKGLARNGRNPTLVNAYGAYQIVNAPVFNLSGIAFVERGGVLVTAHVRGGGEYGKRWWKAGQKITKPNTWRDLIDCCEALVKTGWTSPKQLAIQGGSAGGITVGRALTERPDLFAAVISNVGVSNSLRAEFSPNGPPNVSEFGTITERAGFIALKQMDAMHAVKDGTRYPSVLLTTGMTDPRVSPWQPAKMTARLQHATASKNPVLLRVTFDAGHGLGSTRSQRDAQRADDYAFVFWRTRGSI